MVSGKESDKALGYLPRKDSEANLPRPKLVKNKTPAPVQITAEQILREARERQEDDIWPPKQKITDATDLADYSLRRRKEFEDQIRRDSRWNIGVWVEYAQWEESQKDYARARSVWERALDVGGRNHTLWLKYAEFEMRNKFVNNARNVWDRAVTLLPCVGQLWYKYIRMEEMLGNIAGARQIFERWMTWNPDQQGWLSYVNFEIRCNETDCVRSIFERFILCHPRVSVYLRYANFEMKNGEVARARNVYKRAIEKLGDDEEAEQLFVAFAEFEERYIAKKRSQYEDKVRKNPLNYDLWFDYIRLEESAGNKDRIRVVYDRATANVPPAEEKRYWQRYIYLWINYALYEELEAEDAQRTRDVYRECLKCIPHREFSFAKVWLLAAEFEIRQLNLKGARRILGNAIGKAPKNKIFKSYIKIELQLGNIDRCRKLYERYLEWSPENCYAWGKYAELERSLCETERARAIFELAISLPDLDMPEILWKAYIDFEISGGKFERARALYERLLDRTKHYIVWLSYANFEASAMEEEEADTTTAPDSPEAQLQEHLLERKKKRCVERARAVLERADIYLRDSAPELKEERAALLEEWLKMESSFGHLGDSAILESKLPKKRRSITRDDDSRECGEYKDFSFPEESQMTNLKILEAAYRWKRLKVAVEEE